MPNNNNNLTLLIWEPYYAGLATLVLIPFCIDTIVLIMFHCVGLDRADYPPVWRILVQFAHCLYSDR